MLSWFKSIFFVVLMQLQLIPNQFQASSALCLLSVFDLKVPCILICLFVPPLPRLIRKEPADDLFKLQDIKKIKRMLRSF